MTLQKIIAGLIVMLVGFTTGGLLPITIEAQSTGATYFDDTDPNFLRVGNDYYEIGFRKTNGAIAYIIDKATGHPVSEGSRNECLWGTIFQNTAQPDDYVGGCQYRSDNPARHFSYVWNAGAQRLTLNYIATPPQYPEVNVWVDVTPSTAHWFDMRLFLQNKSGNVVNRVLFPSDMVYLKDDIQSGLIPTMPGIVLKSTFFSTFLPQKSDHQYVVKYPSWPGIFADYLALSSTNGKLALYSISKPEEPLAAWMGFVYDNAPSPYRADSFFIYHTFNAVVNDGVAWTSPTVRIHIGEDYPATLAAYRTDNRIASFPTLKDKLGNVYTQTVQSPILKIDVDKPMEDYRNTFPQIPSPAILHWVSYWIPSFDENYPDFLPPRTDWGTTPEMASLFDLAHNYGFLNMPYTNPTWWDDESPTMQGQSVTEVAFIDENGTPKYECYTASTDAPPCTPANARRDSTFNKNLPPYLWLHGGYAVSPYAPIVQQRLAQLMTEMTAQIPADIVFEDQIGTGDRGYDYNPYAPSATSYLRGWLTHTQIYSNNLLMTESGYDLLARTETGFNGSYLLLDKTNHETTQWWGDGNWYPYPFVTMAARDKTLFYQHNLAPETFTFNKETFIWNLAMGFMLSYDLNPSQYGGGLDSPWLKIVHLFQKEVLAEYADERVTDYLQLQPEVTQTVFQSFAVTTNWSASQPYETEFHTLPPAGVFVTGKNGHISAGIFTVYNNTPLSAGEHFIIEKRDDTHIRVWQPLGADTDINLSALQNWSNGDTIPASVYSDDGQIISNEFLTVENNTVTLPYKNRINGTAIDHYRLAGPVTLSAVYLPLILK